MNSVEVNGERFYLSSRPFDPEKADASLRKRGLDAWCSHYEQVATRGISAYTGQPWRYRVLEWAVVLDGQIVALVYQNSRGALKIRKPSHMGFRVRGPERLPGK